MSVDPNDIKGTQGVQGAQGRDDAHEDDWEDDDFLEEQRPQLDLQAEDADSASQAKADAEDLALLKPPPTPARLALMAGVVLATAWYVYGLSGELRYFFSGDAPRDLGDALELGAQPCADGLPCVPTLDAVPTDTFVRVTGLPTREVPASDVKIGTKKATQVFFQMQNAPIWALEGAEAYVARLKGRGGEGTLEDPIYQEAVTVEGRFINLRDDAEGRYMTMRKAYSEFYPIHIGHFCMDLQPQTIKRLQSERAQGGQVATLTEDITRLTKHAAGTDALLNSVWVGPRGVGYAAGERGTLLKTSDGGQSWRALVSGVPDTVILRDAAFTEDAARGVVVGDDGTVLRTEDEGLRFTRVEGMELSHHVNAVAISPDGREVIAAGSEGLMLHSADLGKTWTPRPTLKRPDLRDLVRTRAGTLIACGDQGALLRSTDGGASWAWMGSDTVAGLRDLALSDDGASVLAVGEKGTALRSDDDGLTWQAAQVNHIPGLPYEEVSADRYRYLSLADFRAAAWHPDGQRVLFVGEQGGLAISRDGAKTITLLSDAYATALMLAHLRDGRGLLAGLWAVWDQHTVAHLNAVAWTGPDSALAVGQGGACLTTDDGGARWRRCRLPLEAFAAHVAVKDIARGQSLPAALATAKTLATPNLNAVAFNARGQGWVVGDHGLTLATADGGKTWRAQRVTSRHIYSLQLSAGGDLALFSGSSGLWGTLDARGGDARFLDQTTRDAAPRPRDLLHYRGAVSLHPLGLPQAPDAPDWATPEPDALDPVLIGADLLITGYSHSRAEHWLRYKAAPAQPRALAVATADTPMTPEVMAITLTPARLAIACGDDGQLLRSSDGGRSFIPTPSGTTRTLRAAALSADGMVGFVGGDGVLLRSGPLLRRWSPVALPPGLADAPIRGLALDADPQRLLIAAGASVWLSEDGAQTFQPTYQGALPLTALALDPTSGAALAVGEGGLVLASTDRGKTWTPRPKPAPATLTAAWIQGADALVTTADGALWRSTDHGQTWALASPPLGAPLLGVTAHPPTATAWAVAADGRRLRSADLGKTWQTLPALTTTPLHALGSNPQTGQVWLAGADQTLFSSADGSQWSLLPIIQAWEWQGKWGKFLARLPSDVYDVAFTAPAPGAPHPTAFAVGGDGLILSSPDGGRTWVTRRDAESEPLRAVAFDQAGKTGLAVGLNHKLLWTENGGESWFSEPTELDTIADFFAVTATGKPPKTDFTALGSQGAIVRLRPPRAQVTPTVLPLMPGVESFRGAAPLPDGQSLLTVGGDPPPLHDLCTPGYLILSGDTPRSNWDDLLYAVLIGGFGVFTAVNLVTQWRRRAAMLRS